LPSLLDPLKVKEVVLRNRIVLPPMQSGRATFEGAVTNRLINFYVKRASAIGLVIVEHAYVSLLGKLSPKQLGIYSDDLVDGFEKLAIAVHETGTPVVLQITHAGGVANRNVIGARPAGPSACGKTRELQLNELDVIADEFVRAAARAIKAGFDGVELHGAHGYLLNQFLTPLLNKRDDEFGGSLENRMRFPLMVVDHVRQVLEGKLLLYRVGADDLTQKGTHIEDALAFSRALENHGVDIVDVSGGMCGADPKQLCGVRGYFIPQASAIKRAVRVPVVGVGRIKDANYADSIVREGQVDLVAVGRALLEDASWAEKAISTLEKSNFG
jgi:2,4-dienoyl-CoA reductase-like NADH-dependent reductase (Old Yellow Enzyme family)